MQESTKHRIGIVAAVLFVFAAMLADIIGLIPIAKDFTATIFWAVSSFILWRKGLGIFNGRKLAVMAISWISGLIPVIQELPIEITAGIIAIIIISRIEEKTGVSVIKPMSGGKMPLNAGGVRQPSQAETSNISSPSSNPNTRPLNMDGMRQPEA